MMAGVDVARVADCPICLGTFKDARVLPCGHTFCLDCITKHGRSKYSDPDCPNCRTKFQIPSNDFDTLPKNYSLNSVLHEKAKVTKGLCKKHDGEKLVLYCVQCNMIICLECMEDNHQKHDCSKISRFAKEAQRQLKGYIECFLSQVKTQKSEVIEESKKFCDLLSKTEFGIEKEFNSIIHVLAKQRLLLLEELINEKEKVARDFKKKTDEIETEHLRLASFNTQIEDMLQSADEATTFDIVCQYKDFKESFDRLKLTCTQAMEQVSIAGIEFIPGDIKDRSRSENIIGRLEMESDLRAKDESSWAFRRVLTRDEQVDHSLLGRFPIDRFVWYYLEHKYKDKVASITQQYSCIPQVIDGSSSQEMEESVEVVPCLGNTSDKARKHVEDATVDFAQLYQEVAESGIVKERLMLPFVFNESIPQQLLAKLEEMGVFFLESDGPCLIGPKACIQEAKYKVSDFYSQYYDRSAQKPRNGYFGLTQVSPIDSDGSLVFMTRGGLTVHVSKGDLLRQSLDAIVSPADENLSNAVGFARAIVEAAGESLQWECNDLIRKNGKLWTAHVMHTSSGKLESNVKFVIHAVGPRKSDAKDEELFRLVKLTVLNCLRYANGCLKVHSLGIPAIGSGVFEVPIEIVSRASFEALKMFDEHYASFASSVLREIYFINEDEATVSIMQGIFQSLMT